MRKKLLYKITSLILASSLLFGCSCSSEDKSIEEKTSITQTTGDETKDSEEATSETNSQGSGSSSKYDGEYLFSIYDDNTKYSNDQLDEQKKFAEFLEEIFKEDMEDCYLNILFTIENPAAMNISTDNITWGSCSVDDMNSSLSELQDTLLKLKQFDYSALDYEGKLIYDTLEKYIENEMIGAKYWYYSQSFSPLDGIQTSLAILLAEIELNTEEDVDNYLELLKDLKRYLEGLCEIEKYKAKNYDFALSDNSIEKVKVQCKEFVEAKENILVSSFAERMDANKSLTDKQKKSYIEKNKKIVKDYVIPGFKTISKTLDGLKGKRKYMSLKDYEGGTEFYSYLTERNSGFSIDPSDINNKDNSVFNLTIEDLQILCEDYVSDALSEMKQIASNNLTGYFEATSPTYPVSEPKKIINYFTKNFIKDFPRPVTTEYEFKYVPESLQESSSPAFYITAPIDNIDRNIIYVNGGSDFATQSLYDVLAHEGTPGHMYQTTYFNSLHPSHIRNDISFIGYVEGFAMYAETYAYDYSGLSEDAIKVLKDNNVVGYGLYSVIDMHVNLDGWSKDDVATFLDDQGYSSDAAEELFYIAIDDPTVYDRYFLGLVGIMELQKHAKDLLDDSYRNINFNKFLLEVGPTYFKIIDEKMDAWSDSVK